MKTESQLYQQYVTSEQLYKKCCHPTHSGTFEFCFMFFFHMFLMQTTPKNKKQSHLSVVETKAGADAA